MKKILKFFDKLEDKTRTRLSRHPVIYAFLGAVAIVLFWRGVWGIADETPFLENPYVSLLVSVIIMLAIGLFVSFFIGDSIILSGLRGEKKLAEKTVEEVKKEGAALAELKNEIQKEEELLTAIKSELNELKDTIKKSSG